MENFVLFARECSEIWTKNRRKILTKQCEMIMSQYDILLSLTPY